MQIHKVTVFIAIIGAVVACDEPGIADPEQIPGPLFSVTSPYDNLTDEEEAELRRQVKITRTELRVSAMSEIPPGDNIAVFTEASIGLQLFFPKIKHDVQYFINKDDEIGSPQMKPGDWHTAESQDDGLKTAFRETFYRIYMEHDCIAYGPRVSLSVNSHHRAKWEYYKAEQILNIPYPVVENSKSDECPRQTTTKREERRRGDTWCLVDVTYYLDTGEIKDMHILGCWSDCPDCMSPYRPTPGDHRTIPANPNEQ